MNAAPANGALTTAHQYAIAVIAPIRFCRDVEAGFGAYRRPSRYNFVVCLNAMSVVMSRYIDLVRWLAYSIFNLRCEDFQDEDEDRMQVFSSK